MTVVTSTVKSQAEFPATRTSLVIVPAGPQGWQDTNLDIGHQQEVALSGARRGGIVARAPQRWTEVTPSQFTHEAEGLGLVRALLPPRDPFRAWSNFEFRDSHGKWHEVDLLVAGQRRLHLVELKYYSGVLRGDDHTWRRDGRRAEDSPLKLARRKAQRLASKLQDELLAWAREKGTRIPDLRTAVPYVQECVFLHHPDLQCDLPAGARIDLFGLDERQRTSGLPGISARLLEPAAPDQAVTPSRSEIVAQLMTRIGVVQRRQREAGSWMPGSASRSPRPERP